MNHRCFWPSPLSNTIHFTFHFSFNFISNFNLISQYSIMPPNSSIYLLLLIIPILANAADESASPNELSPCLTFLCMDTASGCTQGGPKLNFNGKYLNIKQQTFTKCTYETEGQLSVMDKERVRRMSWAELEGAIENCQRNYSCASACIYNYYFTIWERCPRMDMRSGKAFTECEKMAFAYYDQNGWCDEKEHIWEKVRRGLPAIQRQMGESESSTEEGAMGEEGRMNGRGRGEEEEEEENEGGSLASLIESGENHQNERGSGRRQSLRQKNERQQNQEFELIDKFGNLEDLAEEMELAFEARRAEHSFVFGEKDGQGGIAERGPRLVVTDNGEKLELTKLNPTGRKRISRSFLDKGDWPSVQNTLKGICIGLFQN